MAKKLIYVGFWRDELINLVDFLKEKGYDEAQVADLEKIAFREVGYGTETNSAH